MCVTLNSMWPTVGRDTEGCSHRSRHRSCSDSIRSESSAKCSNSEPLSMQAVLTQTTLWSPSSTPKRNKAWGHSPSHSVRAMDDAELTNGHGRDCSQSQRGRSLDISLEQNEIFLICTKTYICIYILKSRDMFFPLWEAGGCIWSGN